MKEREVKLRTDVQLFGCNFRMKLVRETYQIVDKIISDKEKTV